MNIKKVSVCLLLSGAIFFIGSAPATLFGVYAGESVDSTKTTSIITPRIEQTEWRYRVVDGKLQKRLYSITYDKWLTDWQWA